MVTLLTLKKKTETLTLCLRRDLADLIFLLSQGSKPLITGIHVTLSALSSMYTNVHTFTDTNKKLAQIYTHQ